MKHMNLLWIVLLSCLLLAGLTPVRGNARASEAGMDFKAIDDYVTAQMRSARLPGVALVIVEDDRIVYSKGYGQADSSGRPFTPQTPLIIGSVTKPFTALAAMQLVEAGKVDLDAPVRKYISWFRVADPRASEQITVRQLLNQTSGIPQTLAPQTMTALDDGALERAVRALADVQLIGPPGQSFAYSNGNYDTLGLIVQTVSGLSYEAYVQQHIFAPLEMQHSFTSQELAYENGMAAGYRWWFGIPFPVTLPYNRGELPGGYLISSAEDMGHFLIAQMNGGRYGSTSILSPQGIDLTHTEPAPETYGMGWETTEINGRTLINHDGGVPNFQASLFFDPQTKVGVFVGANACNALDTFSSPAGADWRDGPTTRGLAAGVLSLATDRPMPQQGPGHATLYWIYDLVLLALTVLLVVSLARLPGWYQGLMARGIHSSSGLVWRSLWIALLHFTWPLLVLYMAMRVTAWKVLVMLYQPDLGYWLYAVAVVVFVRGLVQILLAWRLFAQAR